MFSIVLSFTIVSGCDVVEEGGAPLELEDEPIGRRTGDTIDFEKAAAEQRAIEQAVRGDAGDEDAGPPDEAIMRPGESA